MEKTHPAKTVFLRFLPFWIFMVLFKFGGGLHYSIISPLGEKLMPLWLVGILMGGGSVIQFLLDVPAGRIMDKYGYLKFLKITTFIFLFAAIAFFSGLTTASYLMSLVMSTFGWLFFGPGVNAYVLSQSPKENAGKFMSLRDVSGSVGIVLSSASLPFILGMAPRNIGFVLFVILSLALAFLFFSPKDKVNATIEQKLPTHHHYIKRHSWSLLLEAIKRLNPASGMLLLSNLSGSIFYGVIWFVIPLVIAHQANSEVLSIGLGIFDLSVVVLGFILGSLADKVNKRALVFFGLLLFSIAGTFTAFNFNWLFLLFGFMATTGDEMSSIALWSWLHNLDKEHASDGAISGVLNFFQDLGWAIGPMIAGFSYEIIGPTWTIVLGASPIFVTWLVYQISLKKHHAHSPVSVLVPTKPHRPRHRT